MKKRTEEETHAAYKSFLRRYSMTDKKVGEAFGYASPVSWAGSHRRKKVIAGIMFLVDKIEAPVRDQMKLIEKLKEM